MLLKNGLEYYPPSMVFITGLFKITWYDLVGFEIQSLNNSSGCKMDLVVCKYGLKETKKYQNHRKKGKVYKIFNLCTLKNWKSEKNCLFMGITLLGDAFIGQ